MNLACLLNFFYCSAISASNYSFVNGTTNNISFSYAGATGADTPEAGVIASPGAAATPGAGAGATPGAGATLGAGAVGGGTAVAPTGTAGDYAGAGVYTGAAAGVLSYFVCENM